MKFKVGLSATIPTGEYKNEVPLYEVEGEGDIVAIKKARADLRRLIDEDYKFLEARRIRDQFKEIRFTEKDGKMYPHVTSIIGAIHPIDFPEGKLRQYAARGTIVHKQIETFFKSGKWEMDPTKLEGVAFELQLMRNGSLGFSETDCDFMGFWRKEQDNFVVMGNEEQVFNDDFVYTGSYDIYCKYQGVMSIADVKTAGDYNQEKLDRYWKQQSAYAKCKGVTRMIIIPLKPKKGDKAAPISKPLVCDDVEGYFEKFLRDRELFKDRFKI